jgi:hypothetical protein
MTSVQELVNMYSVLINLFGTQKMITLQHVTRHAAFTSQQTCYVMSFVIHQFVQLRPLLWYLLAFIVVVSVAY